MTDALSPDASPARADPEKTDLARMADTPLPHPTGTYSAIACAMEHLVAQTGSLGIASVWGVRQLVYRFFIAGFGDAAQRAAWTGRTASVAISEPHAGAHPKHLASQAEPDRSGSGFRLNGEKIWVTNGPSADVFVVLAITSESARRKRYSAFLVPRDAPGLIVQAMPENDALFPARHSRLLLRDLRLPRSALLGGEGEAYEQMARPFRDIEDAVGASSLLGSFRFLQQRLVSRGSPHEAAVSLGAVVALTSVFAESAKTVLVALDAGRLNDMSAQLVGLRIMATDLVHRIRTHQSQYDPSPTEAATRLLAGLDVMLSVARSARLTRQAKLASELIDRRNSAGSSK